MNDIEPQPATSNEDLANFQTESGIVVRYNGRYLDLYPPTPIINDSDDIAEWAGNRGFDVEGQADSREVALAQARLMKAKENIGGSGITARSLEGVEEECPGLENALNTETGKVVVLGAGFSPLADRLAAMRVAEQVQETPVLVDLYNYDAAYNDLVALHRFIPPGTPAFEKLEHFTEHMKTIVAAIHAGHLKVVTYLVGSGNVPDELRNASLIINMYGPRGNTLSDQLAMLAPGGRLMTNYNLDSIPISEGFALKSTSLHPNHETTLSW